MVMEFCDQDIDYLLKSQSRPWSLSEVKCLIRQLLCAVAYLHERWIIHRDLKTSNLLYTNHGQLKVADFGLVRTMGFPLRRVTTNVVTLWYRPPELLLGSQLYSFALDIWLCLLWSEDIGQWAVSLENFCFVVHCSVETTRTTSSLRCSLC